MAWNMELLHLEVEAEFRRLTRYHYLALEDALYANAQRSAAKWAEYGAWWRKTRRGMEYDRLLHRERAAVLKSVATAARTCVGCGNVFVSNAYRDNRDRARVCSPECSGRSRKNIRLVHIGNREAPLVEFCRERGVKLGTAWMRIKRGWSPAEALGITQRKTA